MQLLLIFLQGFRENPLRLLPEEDPKEVSARPQNQTQSGNPVPQGGRDVGLVYQNLLGSLFSETNSAKAEIRDKRRNVVFAKKAFEAEKFRKLLQFRSDLHLTVPKTEKHRRSEGSACIALLCMISVRVYVFLNKVYGQPL